MMGRWIDVDEGEPSTALVAASPASAIVNGAVDHNGRAQVGAELWHSTSDRMHVIQRLSTDFLNFQNDLAAGLATRTAEQKSSDEIWVTADIKPTLAEWQAFAAREAGSWLARLTTSWAVFKQWLDRLRQLRALARAHGIALGSAEPLDLPTTIWERGTTGGGTSSDTLFGFLWVCVYAAVGITGFTALYAALRDLRGRSKTA
jgi:hypothetical protein